MFKSTLTISSSAAAIVAALCIAGAGGYLAHAQSPGSAVNAPGRIPAQSQAGSFADIVAEVAPAVVSINVVEQAKPAPAQFGLQGFPNPFGQGENSLGFGFAFPQLPGAQTPVPVRASGSGFFVSPDGFIVTNNHVVDGAEKITVVTDDQRSLTARVVGRDPATDLAVLKVDGGPFRYVSFEDRARPRVGDWVVAVGNPFGLGGTATAGIVSALGRENVSGSSFVNYMQIDAPINRGNSGGPTFDVEGRVVGINSAIFTPSGGSVGIGFDIPADVAARVTRELMSGGSVTRGYIGATVQTISPELAASLGLHDPKGALIDQLTAGGPADRAGVRAGDLIMSVNGRAVASANDLTRQVAMAKPGDDIRLGVMRDGRAIDLEIKAGLRPSEAALAAGDNGQTPQPGQPGGLLGLSVAPDASGGLVIDSVSPGSDAAQKGLRAGDVILRAGVRPLQSATDLSLAIKSAGAGGRSSIPLLVARGGQRFYVPIRLGAGAG